jgi:hypothetical protein
MAVARGPNNRAKFQHGPSEVAQDEEQELPSPAMSFMKPTSDVPRASTIRLREKLRDLLALRAEIDRDVDALKRTIDILDDSSS